MSHNCWDDSRSTSDETAGPDLESRLTETTLNSIRKQLQWQHRMIQMLLLMTGLVIISITVSFQPREEAKYINKDINKDIIKDIAKDINRDMNRDINRDINQDTNEAINKGIKRDINQDINVDFNQDFNQGINRDISQDINQDTNPDTNQDINQNINQDINEDINEDRKIDINAPFFGADVEVPVVRNVSFEILSLGCQENRDAICRGYPLRRHCLRHQPEPRLVHALGTNITQETCKTLWFAGFHQGKSSFCKGTIGGYRTDYARALGSATVFAPDSLQPVLMLGGYRMNETDHEGATALRSWAEQRGVIVIDVPTLSFMDKPAAWLAGGNSHDQQGPFLRLDIPRFVREHNLFDLPNVCQKYVLYTDADVMFTNPISKQDMAGLKTFLNDETFIMYGRELTKDYPIPSNTGVMLFDVDKFEQEWPNILAFSDGKKFSHDQLWLNAYFNQNPATRAKRAMLPIHWNWKAYWTLEPSTWDDIKIFHFHGPKIGRGFRHASNCNMNNLHEFNDIYQSLIKRTICCDSSRIANRVMQLDADVSPPQEDVC